LFSKWPHYVFIATTGEVMRVLISSHPNQHLLLPVLIVAILVDVKCYLIVGILFVLCFGTRD
jgi:hypothetical protein